MNLLKNVKRKKVFFNDKVDSLRGKRWKMLFTQTGSRFIQKQISKDNDEGIIILNTILIKLFN